MRAPCAALTGLALLTFATSSAAQSAGSSVAPATPTVTAASATPATTATPSSAAETAAREQARQHFERGIELIGLSRWVDAIPELEQARALRVTPAVMYNLGFAQRAVGSVRAALSSFGEFLRLAGEDIQPARRAEVDGFITDLRARLVHVVVHAEPAEAVVWIDGAEVRADAPVELDPGEHSVTVQAPDHQSENRVLTLGNGAREELRVHLRTLERPARVAVNAAPTAARVRLDGAVVNGSTSDRALAPGRHRVEVSAPGYLPYERDVDVRAGEVVRLDVTLQRRPGIEANPWFWLGIAGGVAVTTVVLLLAIPVTDATLGPHTWDAVTLPSARP